VRVSFAPSGRVVESSVVGGSLVGTVEGACVARALRGATVSAFAGGPVTVNTTVRVR
jgi:hypothetical protein